MLQQEMEPCHDWRVWTCPKALAVHFDTELDGRLLLIVYHAIQNVHSLLIWGGPPWIKKNRGPPICEAVVTLYKAWCTRSAHLKKIEQFLDQVSAYDACIIVELHYYHSMLYMMLVVDKVFNISFFSLSYCFSLSCIYTFFLWTLQ